MSFKTFQIAFLLTSAVLFSQTTFNPKTIINYELRITSYVQLKVYDVLLREVSVLANENLNIGTYEVYFDGTNYSSGIYYYTLNADP